MRLQNIRWSRTLRKGAVQLALAVAVLVLGYLIDNSGELGIGAGGLVVLDAIRRVARDMHDGPMAPS